MTLSRRTVSRLGAATAGGVVLAAALAVVLLAATTARAGADGATIAVIGDTPYGAAQIAGFPRDIAEINADPDVRRVIHLGDVKDGSSRCDTPYLAARRSDFDTFVDPLVYTPGDNEWTDCHRASNGGYLPTERLATLRALFFPEPGRTLGRRSRHVAHQSAGFPENVVWEQRRVTFATVHVVGSNDDQEPWFGDRVDPATGQLLPETRAETALRAREFTAREAAAVAWIDHAFDTAQARHAAGVLIAMQADMWDPSAPASALSAFEPIKAVLADRAARFAAPTLLLEGDSHEFTVDTPAGMPANLTRVVVQGSTTTPREWLRLHVSPRRPGVFACENVQFRTRTVSPCPTPLTP